VGNIVTGDDMQTQVNSIGKLDLLFNVFIFCTLMYIILLLSESGLSSVITLA
jgi:hypothetical protein